MNDVRTGAGICAAIGHGSGDTASLRAADWLGLAAAPAFALMALLSGVLGGGPMGMPCSAAHSVSPLSGMPLMYMLMSVFHLVPWLKWVARHRRDNRRC